MRGAAESVWEKLPSGFLALAPMEDVTDTVFRQIICEAGRPDLFFSEFTNADGICSRGYEKVAYRLKYEAGERPIVAQIWGKNPEKFCGAAEKIASLGFDGIDINLGCPVKDVVKSGACSAMIFTGQREEDERRRKQVEEIVEAVKKGAGKLPVSVKTRIGQKQIVTAEWIGFLLGLPLAAITIHGRTAAEESRVAAHWDEIKKAVELKGEMKSKIVIVGNGDVGTKAEAEERRRESGVDGVMIGRGAFENPWIFSQHVPSREERANMYLKHIQKFEEVWTGKKNWMVVKKFARTYISGWDGASEVREKIVRAGTLGEIKKLVREV